MKNNISDVIRARHAVANIRSAPIFGVDSPRITGAAGRVADGWPAPMTGGRPTAGQPVSEAEGIVVALRPGAATRAGGLPTRPTGLPSLSTVAALDGANRLAAIKVTDALGWSAGETLYAQCSLGRVVVRAGMPTEPTHLPVRFDGRKHLCLPSTAVAGLGAHPGAQVFATAAEGDLYLANAAVLAEHVTGVIAPPADLAADMATAPAPGPGARGTHVRPRWHAPQPAAATFG